MATIVNICCFSCGIDFGVPDRWDRARREDGKTFWCPNGHEQGYTESVTDKLRKKVERMTQEAARLADEAALARREAADAITGRAKAERAQARLRKRIQGGACPDCNRTFQNLARHMAHQHGGEKVKPRLVSDAG